MCAAVNSVRLTEDGVLAQISSVYTRSLKMLAELPSSEITNDINDK